MATINTVSIDICPINFDRFAKLNSITKNIDASLLFSKIKFSLQKSKLTNKNGKPCITRTRKQMANWFGYKTSKIDGLLQVLERKNLIDKELKTWWGKKQIFISSNYNISHVPINFELLYNLCAHIGNVKDVIIFSRIAFAFNKTQIKHENKRWCALSQNYLARWSGLNVTTVTKIINRLIRRGFILKKNFLASGSCRVQNHFHISDPVLKILKPKNLKLISSAANKNLAEKNIVVSNDYKVIHNDFPMGKKRKPIRIRTKPDLRSNNTSDKQPQKKVTCDITLNKINHTLTERQQAYLISALERTCKRKNLQLSNPKHLLAEIKFFILNSSQRIGVATFTHAVNRAMKILGDKNWRTPFGFSKYSKKGQIIAAKTKAQEEQWKVLKRQETCYLSENMPKSINYFYLSGNDKKNIIVQEKAKVLLSEIKALQGLKKNIAPIHLEKTKSLIERLYSLLKHGLDSNWLKVKLKTCI